MAVRIANLKILVSANTTGLVSGFSKAKTQVSGFRGTLTTVGRGISKAVPLIATLTAGIASLATITRLASAATRALVRQFTELDKLGKTASKIGVTAEALQKMRFAGKLAGVEVTTTDMALQRFVRRTAEAAVGTGEALKAFQELRIDAKAFSKLSLEDQMKALADAMGRFSNSDQLRIAFKLFDSEGAALVNTLKGGSKALDEMFKDRADLGLFSAEQIARIESANDNLSRLGIQINFIFGAISAELAPILDELVATFVDMGKEGEFNFQKIGVAIRDMAIGAGIAIDTFNFFDKGLSKIRGSMFGLLGLAVKFRKELGGLATDVGIGGFDTPTADRIRGFFDDVADRTADIANNAGAIKDFVEVLPGAAATATPEAKTVTAVVKPIAALIATLPAALEKGSAGAFSLFARARSGERGIKDVAKFTEDTVTELQAQTTILDRLAQKQGGGLLPAAL